MAMNFRALYFLERSLPTEHLIFDGGHDHIGGGGDRDDGDNN